MAERLKNRLSIEEKRMEICANAGPFRLINGKTRLTIINTINQPFVIADNGSNYLPLFVRIELSLMAPGIAANIAFSVEQIQNMDSTNSVVLTGMPNPNFYDCILLPKETLYASSMVITTLKTTSIHI